MIRSAPPTEPAAIAQQAPAPRASSSAPEEAYGFLGTAGDIMVLTWQAFRQAPHAISHYAPEVMRQAGLLAAGSLPIILLITAFSGATCGLEMTVIGRQFGANTLTPGAVVLCTTRFIAPLVFGYILAAKIGCALVAELGAMRAREEVDALDVMGVRSMAFLLTSRLLAGLITLPAIFILAQAAAAGASFLVSAIRFADISVGTWLFVFYSFLDADDLIRVFSIGVAMSVFVLATALYFGYRTRGGPVEVGVATARSMAVNIVGITVINVSLSLTYWGVGAPFPIA